MKKPKIEPWQLTPPQQEALREFRECCYSEPFGDVGFGWDEEQGGWVLCSPCSADLDALPAEVRKALRVGQ